MKFEENTGWDEDGNEEWSRWIYIYENEGGSFDLSNLYNNDKVYVFNYSFRSDTDVDSLGVCFYCDNPDLEMIADWTQVKRNIKKYTIYTGRAIIIPRSNAKGRPPADTHLRLDIGRSVTSQPTLSFYKFSFEEIKKETGSEKTWTVDRYSFNIQDTAFAKTLPSFENETNVLHIKPSYNADNYNGYVIQYDLSDYAGKRIEIYMTMDVWLNKPARVAWQIDSSTPYYPVICGTVAPDWRLPNNSGPALSENEWHTISGNKTIIIPKNGNSGKLLFLSDKQLDGAEVYFANATITITDCTETVNLESVTANGSSTETTTQLELTFNNDVTDLSEDDITLSGVPFIEKRKIVGAGTTYTLPINVFRGGTLNVAVSKPGYIINNSPKTVTIYYYRDDNGDGEAVQSTKSGGTPTSEGLTTPESSYQIVNMDGRTEIMKVSKPGDYAVAIYSLGAYKGKEITITLSVDVKRVGASDSLRWEINNDDYPSVATVNNASAGTWYTMTGTWTGTPSDDYPKLFLSTYDNGSGKSANTTYYIDNFSISIQE